MTRYGIYEVGHLEFATLGMVQLVGTVVSVFFTRHKMLANATNRHVVFTTLLVFSLGVALWTLLGSFGVSMAQTTVVGALVNGALWSTMPGHLGKAWLPMSIGHVLIAAGAWALPHYHFEIFGLAAIPVIWTAVLMERDTADTLPGATSH